MTKKIICLIQDLNNEYELSTDYLNELLDILYVFETQKEDIKEHKNRIEILKEQKSRLEYELEQLKAEKQAKEIETTGVVVPADLQSEEE